jgi:hypothetical protein
VKDDISKRALDPDHLPKKKVAHTPEANVGD